MQVRERGYIIQKETLNVITYVQIHLKFLFRPYTVLETRILE